MNIALNAAFGFPDGDNPPEVASDADHALAEDVYNEDTSSAAWASTYDEVLATNAAFFDAFDTMLSGDDAACEDGWASCGGHTNTTGTCYDDGADYMAPDMLWLATNPTNCSAAAPPPAEGYMALEFADNLDTTTPGCGGRRPIDDVVKTTYSLFIDGQFTTYDDGITPPAGLHPPDFPYLQVPH